MVLENLLESPILKLIVLLIKHLLEVLLIMQVNKVELLNLFKL